MSNDSWVVNLDPSNREGIENREVYGYAGMALSLAQTLENVLKNFIVLATAIERRGPGTLTAEQFAAFKADLEKFEAETLKKTLGPLIDLIKSKFHFQAKPDLMTDLSQSLIDRNHLVHHFFWDRAIEHTSSEGRHKIAEELKRIQKQLRRTIEDFSDATKAISDAMGVTEERVNEVIEAAKAGATEQEIKELIRAQRTDRRGKDGR